MVALGFKGWISRLWWGLFHWVVLFSFWSNVERIEQLSVSAPAKYWDTDNSMFYLDNYFLLLG